MSDYYPEETLSINLLPDECPIKYLPHGLLSDMIVPLIKHNRRTIREQRDRRRTHGV